jgi:dTDP-4-dehydrorhamnose reductase
MLNNREKIWIVGAKGRMGSAFTAFLDRLKFQLLPTDVDDVDITNMDDVNNFIGINHPDVILNCAGCTDIRLCEENPELAYKVNAIGARNLAIASRKIKAVLVQMSTDDVFDGATADSRNEFDVPNPVSVFGKSKLAGEDFVKNLSDKYIIVRSSWVYSFNGGGIAGNIIRQMKDSNEIKVTDMVFSSPTSALEVVNGIIRLLEAGEYGTFHITCKGHCSRYEFALKLAELLHKDVKVIPVQINEDKEAYLRPVNSILDNMMLRICDIEEPVHWEEALESYVERTGGPT